MKLLPALVLLLSCFSSIAQTTVYVRNNTWNDFLIEVNPHGPFQMNTSDWSKPLNTFPQWNVDDEAVFEVNRTGAVIPVGDTSLFDIHLIAGVDTVTLRLMLIGGAGGSNLYFSASAPGFPDAWYNDGGFHQLQTTVGGKSVILKYKADNDDSGYSRDLRFVVHDYPIYEIPADDFQNPHVLNVMAYNVQMIPLGISGLGYANLRGDLLPAELSPYQDAVIYCEIFDDTAREAHLIPAMVAAGFPHRTTILNASSGTLPWNGGVIIFSRWPIEFSAEWDYTMCGQSAADCLSNKGVKYARINKLGKKYHIFGTHMDAGGGQDDILARLSNMREVRNFIAAQNIPPDEAVVYGGDFNISPVSSDGLFLNMLDTLNPVLPLPIGYPNSTLSNAAGKIIDHVWGSGAHLIPLSATNEVITPRSIEDAMWMNSEFSDHRAVLGRFVYPDFVKSGVDAVFCPGGPLALEVNSAGSFTYQWSKDGNDLNGQTSSSYNLVNADSVDLGHYQCHVNYSVTFGDTSSLAQYFFPSGPQVVNAEIPLDFGNVGIDCSIGIDEKEAQLFDIYPNPSNGSFSVRIGSLHKNTTFTLFSSIGEAVYTTKIADLVSDRTLPSLPAGLYYAVLKNHLGQQVRKVVIE